MADDSIDATETDIWASPDKDAPSRPKNPRTPKTPRTPTAQPPTEHIDPEAALRRELDGVRHINEVIEGVIQTLERAGGNMDTVSQTVNNASTLLNSWTRILSQTEHNQRLILHPGWKGATEDLAEQEAEALQKQQAAERRAMEEEQRREELRRRREEEEEQRRLGVPAPSRGSRGAAGTRGTRTRTRAGATRGASSSGYGLSSSGYGTTSSSRGGSGIGRGTGTGIGRGRARGTRGAS